ncbi:hypothetical protein HGRIS_002471 [Hohenbuehelia grisea]|uniref:PH domain-containing protein n=1 Tax=Hohenbuehelia grisea TaxID=104357 RepID=A0ABR3JLY9_9AGAR
MDSHPQSRSRTASSIPPRGPKPLRQSQAHMVPYSDSDTYAHSYPHLSSSSSIPTRNLIEQYESMTSAPSTRKAASGYLITPPVTPAKPAPDKTTVDRGPKAKSPLRRSIQNLVTAFRRRTGTERSSESHSRSPYVDSGSVGLPPTFISPAQLVSNEKPFNSYGCSISQPMMRTGSLLYLTSSLEPGLAAWKHCSATLNSQQNYISVTWITEEGRSSEHIISLVACADVRSITSHQLGEPLKTALVPQDTGPDSLKVFEILFEGRSRERFAAFSVQERAAWVSAIWDVVILDHDKDKARYVEPFFTEAPLGDSRCSWISPKSQNPCLENPLPPIPTQDDHRSASPVFEVSPSKIFPGEDLPRKDATSLGVLNSGHTRVKSPSIANLDRLSVVQQRLAQISKLPGPPALDASLPSRSTRSTEPTTPQDESIAERRNLVERSFSIRSTASLGSNFFIDCYGEQENSQKTSPFLNDPPGKLPRGPENARSLESLPGVKTPSTHRITEFDDVCSNTAPSHPADETSPARSVDLLASSGSCRVNHSEAELGSLHSKVDCMRRFFEGLQETNTRTVQELSHGVSRALAAHQRNNDLGPISAKLDQVLDNQRQVSSALSRTAHDAVNWPTEPTEAKLDDIILLLRRSQGDRDGHDVLASKLEELQHAFRASERNRADQEHQQGDSVRYLNELNHWLEAFVANGTSQIQGVAENVEALCRRLDSGEYNFGAQPNSISTLQATIDRLGTLVNERIGRGSDIEHPMSSEAVVAVITQQRAEHHDVLRALVSEISNEIRGERLRFVDAMKEATAINVQIHVEHFKEELSREVFGMAKEVGRLHKERQDVENKIAELYAFYSQSQANAQRPPVSITPDSAYYRQSQPYAGGMFPGV